jgi:hypothetical protein
MSVRPLRRRPGAAGALLLAGLLAAAGCNGGLHVPEPRVGAATPLPPAEPAVLAIPVTISLGVLRAQLERAFPATDSLDRARCAALGGVVCHQYVYRREPLDVRMTDDRFELTARLRYRGRVAASRVATLGSCGYAPDAMRRAELRFATTLFWRSDWALASRDTRLAADLQDPCRVTALGLDATPLMRRVLDAQLRDLTRTADSLIPALATLAPAADSLWRELQRPAALDSAGSVWLAMGVERASLAPVTGVRGAVSTAVVVTARPRVVLGAAPPADARPLPALTLATAAPGLRIPVDVHLPFADLGRRAATLLAPEAAAKGITVRDVRLWGSADTVVVRVDMAGRLAGTFYLRGLVGYDAAARAVRIDDLRWTIESEGAMTRLKATLGAPLIGRALDQATGGGRLNVGAQLDSLRYQLTQQLNRRLAPGVLVGGGIREVRIAGVHTTGDAIVVRVVLDGDARLILQ